ncbi:MAG: transglycosylase SLT domain-containing protein [Epsilonproteobacteria bacterium]|nr:transglycosylase SLT domain-containing protein [Campylobacterota bacterium]
MMRIPAVIFALLCSLSYGDVFQKGFEAADLKRDINQKLLRAIASHESGLNPFVVGFVIKDPSIALAAENDLKNSPVKFKRSAYKRWSHFALYFQDADQAKKAIPWLEKVTATSTGYDVGLMQINSRNSKRNGWSVDRLISDPDYNIDKGAMILSDCRKLFNSDPAKTLECYNKGTKSSNFDYAYYSSVFKKYYGTPQIAKVVQAQLHKKDQKVTQAEKGMTLPRNYGEGRTLF